MNTTIKELIRQNFVVNNTFTARYNKNIAITLAFNFLRVDCGLNTDTFNVSIPLHDTPDDASYAEMAEYFNLRQKPMALWLWDDLPRWREYLTKSPLPQTEVNLGMYATMDMLDTNPAVLPDFVIKTVQNTAGVQDFADIMALNFGKSAEAQNVKDYYAALAPTDFYNDKALKMYVGYKNGVAVSSGSIVIDETSVGIYDIATLASERRQGFGSAMFHHILNDIKQNYNRMCVLLASPDGSRIYRRAGFVPACDVFVYENRSLL